MCYRLILFRPYHVVSYLVDLKLDLDITYNVSLDVTQVLHIFIGIDIVRLFLIPSVFS